jgi:hypothetical protein
MSDLSAKMLGRRSAMATTQKERRAAVAMANMALTVLTARAGGAIEIPVDEYQEIVERYGGKARATAIVEMLEGGGPKRVRVTLVSREAKQGDLMA